MPGVDRFTATPDPAHAGQPLEICFNNPALSGDTITVELDNGEGIATTVPITLNSSGYGCTAWTVPSSMWDLVNMNQSTSLEHTVSVV